MVVTSAVTMSVTSATVYDGNHNQNDGHGGALPQRGAAAKIWGAINKQISKFADPDMQFAGLMS
jgi:hypothetical protein